MSTPKQPQRQADALTLRDLAALASVHLQQVYNFAQCFDCGPQFYETLKALQLQADRIQRAGERNNVTFHPTVAAMLSAVDTPDFDGPCIPLTVGPGIYEQAFANPKSRPRKLT